MGYKTVLRMSMRTTGVKEKLEYYIEKQDNLLWIRLMERIELFFQWKCRQLSYKDYNEHYSLHKSLKSCPCRVNARSLLLFLGGLSQNSELSLGQSRTRNCCHHLFQKEAVLLLFVKVLRTRCLSQFTSIPAVTYLFNWKKKPKPLI